MAGMDEFDATVAAAQQGFTDIEAARLIGRVLFNAARALCVEYDRNTRLQVLCERIIKAAQRWGIDAESYRLASMMMRRHC
jgi:predicted YcjX-like family ATPase